LTLCIWRGKTRGRHLFNSCRLRANGLWRLQQVIRNMSVYGIIV